MVSTLAILTSLVAAQAPAGSELRLRWNELAPVVTGKRVWLELSGGVRVAGRVQGVEPAGIKVEVTKTSDKKTYPKGLVSIPRSSVSTIQVNKPTGHKGLIIGGAAGGGIAAAMGRFLGGTGMRIPGDRWIIAAAVAGPIAIGLLVGRLVDSIAHHGGQRVTIMAD